VDGKNLMVTGVNFDSDAGILVDGNPQRTIISDSGTLVGKKTAKHIPSGTMVSIQVENGDDAISQSFGFSKP